MLPKKTIVTLHGLPSLEYCGKAYFLNRYNFLANDYNLIILTNRVSFFKKEVKNAKIIYIPHLNLPLISIYLFWLLSRIQLLFIKYNLLLLRMRDIPFALLTIRRPILCYVNVEPYQFIGFSDKNSRISIYKKIFFRLICYGIKKADKIIVPDKRLPNFAEEQNIESNKIEYLPVGVNLRLFNKDDSKYMKAVSLPKNRFIIIYIGSISEKRGLSFLLKSIRNVSSKIPDILLIFLGEAVDRDVSMNSIYNRAKEMGIEDNVLVLPLVKLELVPLYLKEVDVGVSILEVTEYYKRSVPQKIFEYQAMGLPVIANNIPTHNVYIESSKNGFIINNEDEFSDSVLKLYQDKELYEQMSRSAVEFSKGHDIEKILQKFGNIIESTTEFKK